MLDHNLLVIDDVKLLVNNIESKGYKLNKGPKKWRGQVNAMSNKLSCIDIDFTRSLYKHSVHNSLYSPLPKSAFSYNNIHMNLGSVRW